MQEKSEPLSPLYAFSTNIYIKQAPINLFLREGEPRSHTHVNSSDMQLPWPHPFDFHSNCSSDHLHLSVHHDIYLFSLEVPCPLNNFLFKNLPPLNISYELFTIFTFYIYHLKKFVDSPQKCPRNDSFN